MEARRILAFGVGGMVVWLTACGQNRAEPRWVAPEPAVVAGWWDFDGPVELQRRPVVSDDRSRKRFGEPLAAWRYSNPSQTSVSLTIAVFKREGFMPGKRAELEQWLARIPREMTQTRRERMGTWSTADGRRIMEFVLGVGPGGGAGGALMPCRDSRYELVLIEVIDAHDDEDPKLYAHHVKPRKGMREIIEAVESGVVR